MRKSWRILAILVAAATAIAVWAVTRRAYRVPPIQEISVQQYKELPPPEVGPQDWPWWRGPTLDGIAPVQAEQDVPASFGESKNVLWQTAVPGRGHASPTVVGDRILLATADEERQIQSVVCYNRRTGDLLWEKALHQGAFERRVQSDNTHASSTIASDGQRAFALFLNDKKVWLTALDLDGNVLWQTDVGPFASKYGFGSSPAIYKSFVLVAADHHQGGFLAAVHRQSGDIVWRTRRPPYDSYCSPIVRKVAGSDQLLISGCRRLTGYDPATGEELWRVEAAAYLTVGAVAVHANLAVASGGYSRNSKEIDTTCARADGSGEVVWSNDVNIYTSSILSYEGFLYGVTDSGRLYCWEAESGQGQWQQALRGSFSSSPTLAGGHVYLCREDGAVFVFNPNPHRYEQVARNQLGDEIFTTPTICDSRIYLRAARHDREGTRREILYCIGKLKDPGDADDN